MTQRKRVLLVQQSLQPPGGGQGVAVWAIQALCQEYELDLLSWEPIETNAINAFYGTALNPAAFKTLGYPATLRAPVDLDADPYSFQPMAFLMRRTKLIRSRYDLVIGFTNETDYGVRGIQYIHFPYLAPLYRRLYMSEMRDTRLRARLEFLVRPWRIISGFRFESALGNLTLVNSDWTGKHVQAAYNIPTRTLYPPVTGKFLAVPWAQRENGFVAIGRLDKLKRYEDIIAILEAVRARGHAVHLHLVVSIPTVHPQTDYIPTLRALAAQHRDWVHWHESLSRAELERLIATQRYGIHGMVGEHFGMGIAEMVRGGCVVLVPSSGGQVEIVGSDERLTYNSNADAVEKITRVLDDASLQTELQTYLTGRAELFSTDRYMRELREIVREQIQASGDTSASAV